VSLEWCQLITLIPRFFLGPTVNDALANVGRTGVTEISDKYGEIGFQFKHEYEADFAGIRQVAQYWTFVN
jgi:hypothetical protein